MQQKEKNNKFEYVYSAPTEAEKKQIEDIRKKYSNEPINSQDKMARLIKLDAKVKNTATIVALVLGIIGCLIFGLGLTMVLEWHITIWGIVLMAVGCLPMGIAYPMHNHYFEKGKKKYGDEILKLTEELLKQ
jgi:hypothetical protein